MRFFHKNSVKKKLTIRFSGACLAVVTLALTFASHASEISDDDVLVALSAAVKPAMERNQIPGMAVGLVLGDKTYIVSYGVADVERQRLVTDETIFEVGSISKTFTATLATYAEAIGNLSLTDEVETHLPEMAGTAFGRVQLLHLGTHTSGGMPLQVPENIKNKSQLVEYFRAWSSTYKTGTTRTYANPSIGALGWIAANSFDQDFSDVMSQTLFQPLGLRSTYFRVPAERMDRYAWGYNQQNKAVRVNPGVLDSETYGIKTTVPDLLTFLKANMGVDHIDSRLDIALKSTRKSYFIVGKMKQGLIWELYELPIDLAMLKQGNSSAVSLNPVSVSPVLPVGASVPNVWVNKTGATNGFGAYVAFVPEKRFGVVLLANKNYPNTERVEIAYKIYKNLSDYDD